MLFMGTKILHAVKLNIQSKSTLKINCNSEFTEQTSVLILHPKIFKFILNEISKQT